MWRQWSVDRKESSGILPQQVNQRIITDAELWVDAWESTNLPEVEGRLNRTLTSWKLPVNLLQVAPQRSCLHQSVWFFYVNAGLARLMLQADRLVLAANEFNPPMFSCTVNIWMSKPHCRERPSEGRLKPSMLLPWWCVAVVRAAFTKAANWSG